MSNLRDTVLRLDKRVSCLEAEAGGLPTLDPNAVLFTGNSGNLLTDRDIFRFDNSSNILEIGNSPSVPSNTYPNTSGFYSLDFNGDGTSSPFFLTEDGVDINLREIHNRVPWRYRDTIDPGTTSAYPSNPRAGDYWKVDEPGFLSTANNVIETYASFDDLHSVYTPEKGTLVSSIPVEDIKIVDGQFDKVLEIDAGGFFRYDYQATGQKSIRFWFGFLSDRLDLLGTQINIAQFRTSTNSSGAAIRYRSISGGGTLQLTGFGDYGVITVPLDVVANTFYHLEIRLDYNTTTSEILINGVSGGTASFINPTPDTAYFVLGGGVGFSDPILIDNLIVQNDFNTPNYLTEISPLQNTQYFDCDYVRYNPNNPNNGGWEKFRSEERPKPRANVDEILFINKQGEIEGEPVFRFDTTDNSVILSTGTIAPSPVPESFKLFARDYTTNGTASPVILTEDGEEIDLREIKDQITNFTPNRIVYSDDNGFLTVGETMAFDRNRPEGSGTSLGNFDTIEFGNTGAVQISLDAAVNTGYIRAYPRSNSVFSRGLALEIGSRSWNDGFVIPKKLHFFLPTEYWWHPGGATNYQGGFKFLNQGIDNELDYDNLAVWITPDARTFFREETPFTSGGTDRSLEVYPNMFSIYGKNFSGDGTVSPFFRTEDGEEINLRLLNNLASFTPTYIPFGDVDGSLTESNQFIYDAVNSRFLVNADTVYSGSNNIAINATGTLPANNNNIVLNGNLTFPTIAQRYTIVLGSSTNQGNIIKIGGDTPLTGQLIEIGSDSNAVRTITLGGNLRNGTHFFHLGNNSTILGAGNSTNTFVFGHNLGSNGIINDTANRFLFGNNIIGFQLEGDKGNVIIGRPTIASETPNLASTGYDTSATNVLKVFEGIAPTSIESTPSEGAFGMYAADYNGAGTASPYFLTEDGVELNLRTLFDLSPNSVLVSDMAGQISTNTELEFISDSQLRFRNQLTEEAAFTIRSVNNIFNRAEFGVADLTGSSGYGTRILDRNQKFRIETTGNGGFNIIDYSGVGATFFRIGDTFNNAIQIGGGGIPSTPVFIRGSNIIMGTLVNNGLGEINFKMSIGTAPTNSGANSFSMYAADANGAGTASAHFRNENGDVVKLEAQVVANTGDPSLDSVIDALKVIGLFK